MMIPAVKIIEFGYELYRSGAQVAHRPFRSVRAIMGDDVRLTSCSAARRASRRGATCTGAWGRWLVAPVAKSQLLLTTPAVAPLQGGKMRLLASPKSRGA